MTISMTPWRGGVRLRADFGMTYGSDSIGDEIKLYVEVEAIR